MEESLLFMDAGMLRNIEGGWLLWQWTYRGTLFGLLNGLNTPVRKSNKDDCPLEGKCLTESVIYQATVTRSDTTKQETYVGLTENQFKTRYRSHVSSFKNIKYRNSTELSKHIWTLKDANVQYSIKWKVIKRCRPYSNISKRCNLCFTWEICYYVPPWTMLSQQQKWIRHGLQA